MLVRVGPVGDLVDVHADAADLSGERLGVCQRPDLGDADLAIGQHFACEHGERTVSCRVLVHLFVQRIDAFPLVGSERDELLYGASALVRPAHFAPPVEVCGRHVRDAAKRSGELARPWGLGLPSKPIRGANRVNVYTFTSLATPISISLIGSDFARHDCGMP